MISLKIIKVGKDMKRILFIILMFTLINVANAEECTDNKLKELKEQAENIIATNNK